MRDSGREQEGAFKKTNVRYANALITREKVEAIFTLDGGEGCSAVIYARLLPSACKSH